MEQTVELKTDLERAAELEKEGRYDEALAGLKLLASQYPEDIDVLHQLATALLRAGELRESIIHLRKVLFMRPEHLIARTNMGNALLLLGYLDQANEAFSAVLEVEESNKNALYGMASLLLQWERYDEAMSFARKLVELLPKSAATHCLIADIAIKKANMDVAVLHYRTALRHDPGYVPALQGAAHLLLLRKHPEKAREYLEQGLSLQPRNVSLMQEIGKCYLMENQVELAVQILQEANSLVPDDFSTLIQLSIAERRYDHSYVSVVHAAQALRLQPRNKEAGNTLGAALVAANEPDAARALLTGVASGASISNYVKDVIARIEARALEGFVSPKHSEIRSPIAIEDAVTDMEADQNLLINEDAENENNKEIKS